MPVTTMNEQQVNDAVAKLRGSSDARVQALVYALDDIREGTKKDLTARINAIKSVITQLQSENVLTVEIMEAAVIYALSIIDGIYLPSTSAPATGTTAPRRSRGGSIGMRTANHRPGADGLAGAAAATELSLFDKDDVTRIKTLKPTATLDRLITCFETLLIARQNCTIKIPDTRPVPPLPPVIPDSLVIDALLMDYNYRADLDALMRALPGVDMAMITARLDLLLPADDDTPADGTTGVGILGTNVDADRINRRLRKVGAKAGAHERMFSHKEEALRTVDVNKDNLFNFLMDKYNENLSTDEASRTRKSENRSGLADYAEHLKDIEEIYSRTRWSIQNPGTPNAFFSVDAADPTEADKFNSVGTMTASNDFILMLIDSEAVKPAVGTATNRQTAGSTLQEAFLQAASYAFNETKLNPKFAHVFTPLKSNNRPVRKPEHVDVEGIINTCMQVVLAGQSIPYFDAQTNTRLNQFLAATDPSDELVKKLQLIKRVQAKAKSEVPADMLDALDIYNDYINDKPEYDAIKLKAKAQFTRLKTR